MPSHLSHHAPPAPPTAATASTWRAAEVAAIKKKKMKDMIYSWPEVDSGPWMKFTTYTYQGGAGSGVLNQGFKTTNETVALPIPTGLQTAYSNSWDQQDIGLGKSVIGDAIGRAVGPAGRYQESSEKGIIGALQASLLSAGMEASWETIAIGATGSLLGAAGQRAHGSALFSNVYMNYGGPAFRSFSFNFSMKALSEAHSRMIDRIVKFFKLNAMPDTKQNQHWRLYDLPKVFRPTFHMAGSAAEHPWIPKISHCALTDINVTYGGDKYNEFAGSGAPVQVDMTLSFKEVGLVDKQAIEEGF